MEITELIEDKVGGHVDALLNERFLGVLSTKENVESSDSWVLSTLTADARESSIPLISQGNALEQYYMYRDDKPYDIEDIIVSEYGTDSSRTGNDARRS